MDDNQEEISKAEDAVAQSESRSGADQLETSYKLDELAAALKAGGRLLEAANASARAKTIRSRHFARESEKQDEKFGSASEAHQELSAVGWLKKLYRAALIGSAILLVVSVFVRSPRPELQLARELIGSSAAAALLQLSLFPVKTMPRILKIIIVIVGTSLIWMLVGGS